MLVDVLEDYLNLLQSRKSINKEFVDMVEARYPKLITSVYNINHFTSVNSRVYYNEVVTILKDVIIKLKKNKSTEQDDNALLLEKLIALTSTGLNSFSNQYLAGNLKIMLPKHIYSDGKLEVINDLSIKDFFIAYNIALNRSKDMNGGYNNNSFYIDSALVEDILESKGEYEILVAIKNIDRGMNISYIEFYKKMMYIAMDPNNDDDSCPYPLDKTNLIYLSKPGITIGFLRFIFDNYGRIDYTKNRITRYLKYLELVKNNPNANVEAVIMPAYELLQDLKELRLQYPEFFKNKKSVVEQEEKIFDVNTVLKAICKKVNDNI